MLCMSSEDATASAAVPAHICTTPSSAGRPLAEVAVSETARPSCLQLPLLAAQLCQTLPVPSSAQSVKLAAALAVAVLLSIPIMVPFLIKSTQRSEAVARTTNSTSQSELSALVKQPAMQPQIAQGWTAGPAATSTPLGKLMHEHIVLLQTLWCSVKGKSGNLLLTGSCSLTIF